MRERDWRAGDKFFLRFNPSLSQRDRLHLLRDDVHQLADEEEECLLKSVSVDLQVSLELAVDM